MTLPKLPPRSALERDVLELLRASGAPLTATALRTALLKMDWDDEGLGPERIALALIRLQESGDVVNVLAFQAVKHKTA